MCVYFYKLSNDINIHDMSMSCFNRIFLISDSDDTSYSNYDCVTWQLSGYETSDVVLANYVPTKNNFSIPTINSNYLYTLYKLIQSVYNK